MKIGFVVDHIYDFDKQLEFGGAEISQKFLKDNLISASVEIRLITAKNILELKNVDVIHVHGANKFLLVSFLNLFLRKPLVITVRDYRLLCNLGMCLLRSDHICTSQEYLSFDLPYFLKNYSSLKHYPGAILTSLWQLLPRPFYKFFLKKCDRVICISAAQEKIYRSAGILNTVVIHNLCKFNLSKERRKRKILFAGKYSRGKGKIIIDELLPRFLKKYPTWNWVFAGRGGPNINDPRIQSLGKISFQRTLEIMGQSALVIMPSVWPEPFGRSALDALSVGTPVVASNQGGLPEIVENEKYGLLAKANTNEFQKALEVGIKRYQWYQEQIVRDLPRLKNKFEVAPVERHVAIYKALINK